MLTLSGSSAATPIRIRTLKNNQVWCRPASSDPWVLWDVFFDRYQTLPLEIENPKSIVDLGANVGYTTIYYGILYPKARILAVEMDGANYRLACRNVTPIGSRCSLVHAAVWSRDGQIEYCGEEEQGYRVTNLECNDSRKNVQSVASRGVLSILDEYGFNDVDFVKMDIEGAESEVFRGPLDWLTRVNALKIELHPPMTLDECAAILGREGFVCRKDDRHDKCLIAIRSAATEVSSSVGRCDARVNTNSGGPMCLSRE
jgi:FkbM family methyltransferase